MPKKKIKQSWTKNEMVMLLGNFERRLFSLFKPGYATMLKGNPRQEGSDGFQTFKYENN